MKNILFIGAHPDDIELGCGATISKLKKKKCNITWVVLSSCNKSLPDNQKDFLAKEVIASSEYFSVLLKFTDFEVRDFHHYRSDIREYLHSLSKSLNIDTIFTHNLNDIHQDHQVVADESVRVFNKKTNIIMYAMPYNIKTNSINFYSKVDNDDIDKKIESLSLYKSQHMLSRSYFSEAYIRSMAVQAGVSCAHEYAECFTLYNYFI